ncbi:hypothetical protein CRM22_008814 [Opisthorchis felineus]|uniref:Uncharacterized protein n=1 Tax=Opisthorchis felineus TaxID=147828 RepID=A0A4S2L9G6_OPIFE|nr:hypothetical protein CRM22_008814 [Opisthorchis felineus]
MFIVVADSINSPKYIPISYDVARFVESWKALSTEFYSLKADHLGVRDKDMDREIRRLVETYGSLMEHISPCPSRAYVKTNVTQLALRNYNALLKYQYGGTNFVLPNIQHHPGLIPSNVNSTTVVVTV